MKNIEEISKKINELDSDSDITNFFLEILSESELATLSKRWQILSMLSNGRTQRDIAKELNVSLCKVTRGSKILKNQNAVVTRLLKR